MNEFYTVKEIALMSGLTERTIRHYIQTGILKGSKADGIWKFTPEEVDAFFAHPSVFPGILSKRNGVVSDFLVNRSTSQNRICAILDLPKEDRNKVSRRLLQQSISVLLHC
ncbi:MAG: helix-turn-helix domain-containing protein [Lachnospiraceae bacterium]|nr:helix-turn-helix domain-containing protein [Lachnospiraceae bacterium]